MDLDSKTLARIRSRRYIRIPAAKMTPSDLASVVGYAKVTFLFAKGAEIGRAAIWNEPDVSECYYQKALHRLRPIRGYNVQLMLNVLRRSSIHWFSDQLRHAN